MTDYFANVDRLKEEIKKERRWNMRCLAILAFHTTMQATRDNVRNYKWKIEDTASELKLSIGYVSESIKLAKAIGQNNSLIFLSRDEALKRIRNGEKV